MKDKYIAGCWSNYNYCANSFDTEEDAWEWIKDNHLCQDCLDQIKVGYKYYEDVRYGADHPSQTPCGLEWDVMTEMEFEELGDE